MARNEAASVRPGCRPADPQQGRFSGPFAVLPFSVRSGAPLTKGRLVCSSGFPATHRLSGSHVRFL